MDARHFDLADIPLVITRSGYTGEDGFEISIPGESATIIVERLLSTKKSHPCWSRRPRYL